VKEKDQRISALEKEISSLRKLVEKQSASDQEWEARFAAIEKSLDGGRKVWIAPSVADKGEH